MKKPLGILLIWGLLLGTSLAQAGNCFLWELRSATAKVYLLGSVHMMKPEHYPLDSCIDRAYDDSDTLVVEINPAAQDARQIAQMMQQKGLYPAGQSVGSELSEKTLGILEQYLTTQNIPLQQVQQLRPWYLGLTLTLQRAIALGYRADLGVDLYLVSKAAGVKPVLELETMAGQLAALSGDSPWQQDFALRMALEEMTTLDQQLGELVAAWQAGDAAQIERIMREPADEYPALEEQFQRLVIQRNQAMAEKIDGFLQGKGHYLVVVGAGHVGGRQGVLSLLKQKGYSDRQLPQLGATMLSY